VSAIIGLAGIAFSLWFVFAFPSPGFKGYFDLPSFILLVISPPSIVLLSHRFSDFVTGIQTLFQSAFSGHDRLEVMVINQLTQAAALVRSEGVGSLVKMRDRIRYDFFRDGVSLIVNDFTEEEIRHNLTAKINTKQQKMSLAASMFENMSKISPGVGMLGTLLGLIGMMATLNDPSKIGAGMALSLITTMYGVILGTFIYAPCAEKISLASERILEIDTLVLEGVMALKGKKSSVHLNNVMKTFASQGKNMAAGAGGGQRPRR
jgi:chemotaxis protein MotA